jgi:hypothetical protein
MSDTDTQRFLGWNESQEQAASGSSNLAAGSNYTVTKATTFYAAWRAIDTEVTAVSVTYHANGGTGAVPTQESVYLGTTIEIAGKGALTKGADTFLGWSKGSAGTTVTNTAGSTYTVEEATDFYAVWSAAAPTILSVSFNKGNTSATGTVPATQAVAAGTAIELPNQNGLSYLDHYFVGWKVGTAGNTAGTDADYAAGSSYTVTASTTLYAVWAETAVSYTLTYDVGTGTGTPPAPYTGAKGTNVTSGLPDKTASMSKAGSTFAGWNDSESAASSGTAKYPAGATYTLDGNAKLYAVWVVTNTTPTYSVTYSAGAGSGDRKSTRLNSSHCT